MCLSSCASSPWCFGSRVVWTEPWRDKQTYRPFLHSFSYLSTNRTTFIILSPLKSILLQSWAKQTTRNKSKIPSLTPTFTPSSQDRKQRTKRSYITKTTNHNTLINNLHREGIIDNKKIKKNIKEFGPPSKKPLNNTQINP